jgi:lysozyme
MNISNNGIKLIESFEGLRLDSYQDVKGVWTIGYGHTLGVLFGQSITQSVAEQYLKEDIQNVVNALNHLVKFNVSQNQFDALCSLVFNIGVGNFEHSTLLKDLNAGEIMSARDQFLLWDKVSGESNQSLLNRRLAEQKLFNT